MAITIGTTYATDSTGWTTFGSPLDVTAVFYVANSGNDANSGLRSAGVISPLATPGAAYSKAASAYSGGKTPWILFREGDVWADQIITNSWNIFGSGTVTTPVTSNVSQPNLNPIIVASYHESAVDAGGTFCTPFPAVAARPQMKIKNGDIWLDTPPYQIDKIIFAGLEFYAYQRDPGNVGYSSTNISSVTSAFNFQGATANPRISFMLFEGCKFSFLDRAVGLQDSTGGSTGLIARRNIVVDFYQAGNINDKRGVAGFYNYGGQFDLLENVIDGIETGFNATLGAGKTVTISNNGSGKILVTWPDKFFPVASPTRCSIAFTQTGGNITAGNTYHTGQTYDVLANVNTAGPFTFTITTDGVNAVAFAGTEVTSQTAYWVDPRGNEYSHHYYWTADGLSQSLAATGTLQGNIFGRCSSGGKYGNGGPLSDNTFIGTGWQTNFANYFTGTTQTIGYNVCIGGTVNSVWNGGGNKCIHHWSGGAYGNPVIHLSNIYTHGAASTDGYESVSPATITIQGDIVYKWATSATPGSITQLTQFDAALSTYTANNFDLTGLNTFDATNRPNEPFSVDPERTAGSYYDTVAGGSGHTNDDFCNASRAQSKQNWNSQLTANSLNNYIRAGFGQAAYPASHRGGHGLKNRF